MEPCWGGADSGGLGAAIPSGSVERCDEARAAVGRRAACGGTG